MLVMPFLFLYNFKYFLDSLIELSFLVFNDEVVESGVIEIFSRIRHSFLERSFGAVGVAAAEARFESIEGGGDEDGVGLGEEPFDIRDALPVDFPDADFVALSDAFDFLTSDTVVFAAVVAGVFEESAFLQTLFKSFLRDEMVRMPVGFVSPRGTRRGCHDALDWEKFREPLDDRILPGSRRTGNDEKR